MSTHPKLSLRPTLRLRSEFGTKRPPPGVHIEGAPQTHAEEGLAPSIDAILARTRPHVDRALQRRELELAERERSFQEQEKKLIERARFLREREIDIEQQEREFSEWEMLLDAREHNVTSREAMLLQHNTADEESPYAKFESMRAAVEAREAEARCLSEKLNKRLQELKDREASLDARENRFASVAFSPDASEPSPEAETSISNREAALDEREQMLAEREAFIEKSENVLFSRAQELQELEAQFAHLNDEDGGDAPTI